MCIGGIDLDQRIYRIVPIRYFLDDAYENKLTLMSVLRWSDPLEGLCLRRSVQQCGKPVELESLLNGVFGQSWTKRQSECEGMWRLYTSEGKTDAVRISTTRRKLVEALHDASPCDNSDVRDKFVLVDVIYEKAENLDREMNNGFYSIDLGAARNFVRTVLQKKREEFDYESEVRLVYYGVSSADMGKDRKVFNLQEEFSVSKIFDQVKFSPFMKDPSMKEKYQRELEKIGYKKEQISSSTLYEPQNNKDTKIKTSMERQGSGLVAAFSSTEENIDIDKKRSDLEKILNALATAIMSGNGEFEPIEEIQKSAKRGDAVAQARLGAYHLFEAIRRGLRVAAAEGNADAQKLLNDFFSRGRYSE